MNERISIFNSHNIEACIRIVKTSMKLRSNTYICLKSWRLCFVSSLPCLELWLFPLLPWLQASLVAC
jgi:hypothetical protein